MAFFDTCTQLHAQTVVPGILVHRHSYQTPLYPIRFPSSSGVHAPGGIVAWARTGGVSSGVATASDNNSAKATFAKRRHCLRLESIRLVHSWPLLQVRLERYTTCSREELRSVSRVGRARRCRSTSGWGLSADRAGSQERRALSQRASARIAEPPRAQPRARSAFGRLEPRPDHGASGHSMPPRLGRINR